MHSIFTGLSTITGASTTCASSFVSLASLNLSISLPERTPQKSVDAPVIAESPVNIECKVEKIVPLGSHHMFMAKVVNIMVDDDYMEDNGRFALEKTNPLIYSHGGYYETGKKLGTFGYSVRKKKKRKKPNGRKK